MNFFLSLLKLFFSFFKIGLFTFGGGYSAIPLIQNDLVETQGLISYERFLDMVAISESTPGPFAINIATFIGSEVGGFLGSAIATLGFVLPSFIIILLVAIILAKILKAKPVQGILNGISPTVVGLIFASGTLILLKTIFAVPEDLAFDRVNFTIFVTIALIYFGYKKKTGKKLSPIFLIIIAAILGILGYSFWSDSK